jgi:cytochrome c oxidase cbb3-type subunit 3
MNSNMARVMAAGRQFWLVGVALVAVAGLSACGGGADKPVVSEQQIAELRTKSAAFDGKDAQQLLADPAAVALGGELFQAHCASCHGADASDGTLYTPSLKQGVFDYGDSVDAIRNTITNGRHSVMPQHGSTMGEVDIGSLVSYVQSISSGEKMDLFLTTAQKLYSESCVNCHGPDAHGNPEIGAPDLTDSYFQRGNSMMNIRMTITRGAESTCPAQTGILSGAEIELLTANVLSLRAG